MMNRHMIPALGMSILCVAVPGLLWAGTDADRVAELRTGELRLVEQQEIGLEQAIVRVRQDTGGQVLDAHSREDDERRVHVIKVLTPQGHIRLVPVDANTGELLIGD